LDLREAAERLNVHYQTAYRWIRNGSLAATKIGPSYQVSDAEVARFLAHRLAPTPPPKRTNVRDWDLHAARLQRHLVAGDELAARALVDRLVAGHHQPLSLCEQLFSPVLVAIGEQWAGGGLSVAHEHRASAICERLIARIAVYPRGRPRGVAVVCTPPGEQHSIPAAMAAVVLRADRWRVHHLGTEVPPSDLTDFVDDVDADLVVISTTNAEVTSQAEAPADGVNARVLVGGAGRRLTTLVQLAR
jgi:excisionase family DNA binding protein